MTTLTTDMQTLSIIIAFSLFCAVVVKSETIFKSNVKLSSELILSSLSRIIGTFDGSKTNSSASDELCYRHVDKIITDLGSSQQWALQFLDAWAKFPSGVLYGHLTELGNYDQCLSIRHKADDSLGNINGQYCLASIPLEYMNVKSTLPPLTLGICFPETCSTQQVDGLLKSAIDPLSNKTFVASGKCTTSRKVKFDALDWTAIGLFSVIALATVASTGYEGYMLYNKGTPKMMCLAFSLISNFSQLFRTDNRKSANVVGCLNGIRCLSIVWVVFGHSYMMLLLLPNINSAELLKWVQSPFSMFLKSATMSVDSFFFLSGFLLAWVAFKEMEKTQGKLNIPLMYAHRYIRLTPVVAVTVLFFVSLFRHIGDGPLWSAFSGSNQLCAESWWAALLYVQNYAYPGKLCLGHTWYLSVDFQLYLISPLLLIPLWKWGKRASVGLFVFALSSVIFVFVIIVVKDLNILKQTEDLGGDNAEMRLIYIPTHARLTPWVIGILAGWWIYKSRFQRVRISKVVILLGWVLSVTLIITVIFALYPQSQTNGRPLSSLEGAFYLSLSRLAWPLALSWIVFACVNGYGGFVNTFLSWTIWQPLSRLTYCIYITHLIVETINAGSTKTNTHFSDYDAILKFWGDFGITLFVSVGAYLTLESPMIGIEKVFFAKPPKTLLTASKENICEGV